MSFLEKKTCRICLTRGAGLINVFGSLHKRSVSVLVFTVCKVKVKYFKLDKKVLKSIIFIFFLAWQKQKTSTIDLWTLSCNPLESRIAEKTLWEERKISYWSCHGRTNPICWRSWRCQNWTLWCRRGDRLRRSKFLWSSWKTNYTGWISGDSRTNWSARLTWFWLGALPENKWKIERKI